MNNIAVNIGVRVSLLVPAFVLGIISRYGINASHGNVENTFLKRSVYLTGPYRCTAAGENATYLEECYDGRVGRFE